jgi:hypothetical protein
MQTKIGDFFYNHRLYIYRQTVSQKPCIPSTFEKISFDKFSLVCYTGRDEDCILGSSPKNPDKTTVACHISLLQKAVRRFNLKEGLKAFDWLWENSLTSLLRRLNILSVEDGFYNPEDNCLWIWMYMIHTRGYILGEKTRLEAREALIRLILHPLYSRKFETSKPETPFTLTCLKEKGVLLPLFLRYQYGGKHGDMMMIYDFVQRYRQKPKLHAFRLETPTTGPLYQACDFHVFPWLAPTEEIREKIWKHRSGINFRYLSEGEGVREEFETYDEKCQTLYRKYIKATNF